jgi:FkbM family methyltransferase
MLLDFSKLVKSYNLEISGIIHIGAHFGQEIIKYQEEGLGNIILFEPLSVTFSTLQNNIKGMPGVKAIQLALGNYKGVGTLNVETANEGQSSSLLKPLLHTKQYPDIVFEGKEEVMVDKLDNILPTVTNTPAIYNFINIDVQGYELEVFKGAKNHLKLVDYIMTEVNREELYENCCLVSDLDNYLKKFNFNRVETNWAGGTWGDALYIKEK